MIPTRLASFPPSLLSSFMLVRTDVFNIYIYLSQAAPSVLQAKLLAEEKMPSLQVALQLLLLALVIFQERQGALSWLFLIFSPSWSIIPWLY